MVKKITVVGRANVGKTSITKLIFEGLQPKDLMINPLSPTRGIVSDLYKWLDLELAIFDTSGQELPNLLIDKEEQLKAFENADAVIYIFDYPNWATEAQKVIEEIIKLFKIIKNINPDALFYLIFHKVDLINQKQSNNFQLMKIEVKKRIGLPENVGLSFTSIYPELYFSTFNAFSRILSNFSKESTKLKNLLDDVINKSPSVVCFLTDQNDKIISQSISDDITTQIINNLYPIIDDLLNIEGTDNESEKQIYVDSGANIFTLITHEFEASDTSVKNVLVFSKNLNRDVVMNIKDEIVLKIQKISNN